MHVEPQGDKVLIRLSVDGRVEIWRELGIDMHALLVSRMKVPACFQLRG